MASTKGTVIKKAYQEPLHGMPCPMGPANAPKGLTTGPTPQRPSSGDYKGNSGGSASNVK